jgi:hypothetical protein
MVLNLVIVMKSNELQVVFPKTFFAYLFFRIGRIVPAIGTTTATVSGLVRFSNFLGILN